MNDRDSLVSVIIPTYNRAQYLPDSIASVLKQTYHNLELIVIDDGSTDNTREVVQSFEDQRISYYREPHLGVISEVRNKGLTKTNGKYIAYLDSDDNWESKYLEKQLDQLLHSHSDAVFCGVIIFYENGKTHALNVPKDLSQKSSTADIFNHFIYNRLVVYTSSLLFKKSVIGRVGHFDTSLNIAEMEFIARIITHCSISYEASQLVRIRKHLRNTSSQNRADTNFTEKFMVLDRLYKTNVLDRSVYKKSYLLHYQAIVRSHHPNVSVIKAFYYFLRCLKIDPFSYENYTSLGIRLKNAIIPPSYP